MTSEQRAVHREKVGLRAEAILGQFWRDDETSDAERALELEGWMDVLEVCSHVEIRKAWAEYQRSGPRTKAGKLYKPDAGALYRIVVKMRPAPPTPARLDRDDEERDDGEPRCSRQAALEILKSVGSKINASGYIEKL